MGWKKRLKQEYRQLDKRHHKLAQFLENSDNMENVPLAMQNLLLRQSEIMGMYLLVLDERIDYLKDK